MNSEIKVQKSESGEIRISFPYNPTFVKKVKTIKGYRWHPDGKYCLPAALLWQAGSFHNSDGVLKRVLKNFESEEIHLDPALPKMSISHCDPVPSLVEGREKQSQNTFKVHLDTLNLTKGGAD